MTESITFPLQPGSAAQVRAFLRDTLTVDSMRSAEAALLATELVANAVQHGGAQSARLWVEPDRTLVRIGVSHPAEAAIEGGPRGFGFTLVDKMSHAWGTDYSDGEVHVWFDIRRPGSVSLPASNLEEGELVDRIGYDPASVEELVNRYRPLAVSISRRYRGKGIGDDDLEQVAVIALLKAVHRFDASRGSMRSFAAVTVAGELKRQLRDRGWSVRVPRGLQERALAVVGAAQRLTQQSGQAPKVSELASALELTEEEVSEALSVAQGYSALSLDDSGPDDGPSLSDVLGDIDLGIDDAETRSAVTDALSLLSERDRLVIYLRFFEDLTQTEIAEQIGVSQMQVSRILTRALDELGDHLVLED